VNQDELLTPDVVARQLNDRRADAVSTLEVLEGLRATVQAEQAAFENPQAVTDYLEFFRGFISHVVTECERVGGELASGPQAAHVTTLRQLAANSAAEQRRCLQFRDKCINRPLPHERLRPLLNEISITTRDQLTAFRDFTRAADRLDQLLAALPPSQDPSRSFDRRALFTRLLKRDEK
jgi:hypothetical protein